MPSSSSVSPSQEHDRSMMAHEAETIIPGSFVVLQGSSGDGMSDTISTCPVLPLKTNNNNDDDDDGNIDDEMQQDPPQPPRSSSAEEFQHVENAVATTPLLGQLATQKRTSTAMGIMTGLPTAATTAAAVASAGATATSTSNSNSTSNSSARALRPHHHRQSRQSATNNTINNNNTNNATDDFIVVTDDQASEPGSSSSPAAAAAQNASSSTDPRDAAATEDWKQECRHTEIRNRKDFRESLHQTASALMDHTITKLYDERDMWWQSEGRLCIFRDLPTKLHNGTVLRTLLGTVSPGTTVVATDIVYLNSQTLTKVAVNPISQTGGMAPHQIFPKGRMGWVQMVRLDNCDGTNGRSGYVCLSLDGYPLMAPGLPSLYADPHVWIWRVTCPAGAYVREGLALLSQHLDTLPYGSLIRVTRRTINAQGLSRLLIHAMIPDSGDDNNNANNKQRQSTSSASKSGNKNKKNRKRWVNGWISEFLNPQSGQRGIVAQPLSFPVPALYRVTLTLGAVIRSDIELSSPQIGNAPMGSVLPIVGRAFSEHPSEKCLERLQLAGNGGWISVRLNRPPPHDDLVVEFVGMDSTFDPDSPGEFHLRAERAVQSAEEDNDDDDNNNNDNGRSSSRVGEDLSSIDDNSGPSDSSDMSGNNNNNNNNTASTKTTYRRNCNAGTAGGGANSKNDPRSSQDTCLICLTSERNATIVHGETGHVACCLTCARIIKARGDKCPVCRLEIDLVIQQFWA